MPAPAMTGRPRTDGRSAGGSGGKANRVGRLHSRTFVWHFDQPPERMWRALADTARFNEAAGLPKHAIEEIMQPDGSLRFFAEARRGPFRLAWEEIPVEWVDARRFRHLRVFSKGPLKSLSATLRIEPEGPTGSVAHYTVEAEAANAAGELILRTGFFPTIDRQFTALARRARDWAAGEAPMPFPVPAYRPDAAAAARLEGILGRLERSPLSHGLARRFADWLLSAQELDVQRIRPIALARDWGLGAREVIEASLEAVREGLLQLRWDLLCPRCRGAKIVATSLDQVPTEAHCSACNVSYSRDFGQNVELSFQPNPAIRPVSAGEYCLFGPMTTPHIKVQINLDPGAEAEIGLYLPAGPYRLRTLQIGGATDIDHDGLRFPEVVAGAGEVYAGRPVLEGIVRLVNREDRPRTLIVESREWAKDALTAHRVTALQCFRDLFPDQALRQGDAVDISHVSLVFTDLKGSTAFFEKVGDIEAFRIVREHFAFLAEAVREHEGAIVKTIGDAVMAVFVDPAQAVRATLAMQAKARAYRTATGRDDVVVKVGVHAGSCVAVALNGRLDYFGSTVNMAARLQGESRGGDIVLSRGVFGDPAVLGLLDGVAVEQEEAAIRGFAAPVTYFRLTPEAVATAISA